MKHPMKHRVKSELQLATSSAQDMNVGDIAVIQDGGHTGFHVMRTHSQWVLLERPYTTWTPKSSFKGPNFSVTRLARDSVITITVGEG